MIGQELTHLCIGVVTKLHPSILGRLRVKFPHLDDTESDWCSIVTPMAGNERGLMLIPEPGDHVLVGFEHGDPLRGFILGGIWNQRVKPPTADGKSEENNHRFIKSRSGHVIRLDDTKGKERIEIIDQSGDQSITVDCEKKKITVKSGAGDVDVLAPSGKVTVNSSEALVRANKVSVEATEITLKSQGTINIEASGALTLKGATVNIN